MSNKPNNPSTSDASQESVAATRNYGLLSVAVLPPAIVAVWAWFMVPKFANTFAQFGVGLPVRIKVLAATYSSWGVVAISIGAMWILGRQTSKRQRGLLIFGVASAVIMFFFCLWACFASVSDLASKV